MVQNRRVLISEFTNSAGLNVQFVDGEEGDGLLIYHHGTPAAGTLHEDVLAPARANNLRIVQLVRPGYGGSTRMPGRTVADIVPLADELADHLGYDEYVTMGWSGGGPHALGNVALSNRCRAGMCLAGVGMFNAPGLDFLAGMGQENLDEFGAALAGEAPLRAFLNDGAEGLRDVTGDEVIDAMSTLLPQVDRDVLTDEMAQWFAEELRWAVSAGVDGWLDDDIAFTIDWGFRLDEVTKPITLWQGSEDLMVPFAHGVWLAARLPDVEAHLVDGHGHLSIGEQAMREGFAFLRARLDA